MKRTILFLSLIAGMKSLANDNQEALIETTRKQLEELIRTHKPGLDRLTIKGEPIAEKLESPLSNIEKINILHELYMEEHFTQSLLGKMEFYYRTTGCATSPQEPFPAVPSSCKKISEMLQEYQRIATEKIEKLQEEFSKLHKQVVAQLPKNGQK